MSYIFVFFHNSLYFISFQSLNSKQRQLRKSGNELPENDAAELQRVSSEQAILQKHLDTSRKQHRQHGILIQEYQNKQQQRQTQSQPNEPCSPLMSPSQHSPMHSPAALVSQSPGPSMIQHSPATPSIVQHSPGTPLLQHSPGNPQSTNPGTMSPHNVQQQSPRIGTPHSQSDESPFSPGPMPSPGLCNPNTTRMTSPQHRAIISGRLATSPGAFTPETRNQQQLIADQGVRVHSLPQRFVRPEGAQRRGVVYNPQPGQQLLNQQQHQQLLQRQQIIQQQHEGVTQDQGPGIIVRGTLQRQQVFQQQQHEGVSRQQILQQQQQSDISQDGQNVITQRNLQMVQQRQILQQQQQTDIISQEGQNVTQRNLQTTRQQIIQQQQQESISQDGQNVVTQRSLQMTQQRQQILQQQQQILQQPESVSQDGQSSINQRSLQVVSQQQRQILQQQQQNDIISQESHNVVAAQRNLQMAQQRQQILQQQQQILQQQHEVVSQSISQEGQNSIGPRTLQMIQQRQQMLQQQQQEGNSQDGQNITVQRHLQIAQQRQQHENVSQNISQEIGQNVVQRTLQMAQHRQQILQHQQHENISQDGQNTVAQRNLQIAQQRQQQILQQQHQHEDVSQDGQSAITQRSLQLTQQRPQILQQQHESVSQSVSQEGQNTITQRSLQLVQRQQILHQQQQQHEVISQEGQASIAQRSLQMAQQRQQILHQQQHEGVSQGISQEGQNSIGSRSLQMAQQRQHILQQQQQRQFLQMQQQQQKPPNSPMVSQASNSPSPQLHQQLQQGYGQPPSSPMVQQATMGSPMLQQQLNPTSQPPSPMNRISPMLHGSHHHSSTTNQPPSSPMMPRSPMVAGSPMQMQRRQSTGNSPAMPDRPQSVENPGTPRTPHTPHNFVQQNANLTVTSSDQQSVSQQISQQVSQEQNLSDNLPRGGGNSNNSLNPIPFVDFGKTGYIKLGLRGGSPGDAQEQVCQQISQEQIFSSENSTKNGENLNKSSIKPMRFPNFGRFGWFKLGLRGGSPMWSSKAESSKGKGSETSQAKKDQSMEEKANTSTNRKTARISSLVCVDYNDFDDDSHTPPQASPTILEIKSAGQASSLTSSTLDNGSLTLESPGEKLEQLPDTTDYDDDKTIVNTEVTLSSTAQRDSDDITVIDQFGDSELVDVISGTLEGDMQEEYVLFEPGMVVDLSADSNDSLCHALVNDAGQGHDLVQILEIDNSESQSEEPILSDEDLVPSHSRNKKGLRLDIVRTLQSGKKLVAVTDTPESPDQEDLRVDPSPGPYLDQSPDQELMVSLVNESEVVIIDPTTKSPEDNLSKGSCDEEIEKTDNIQIDVSKENTSNEGSTNDQTRSLKQNKSPTNFIFGDKSYTKISVSTVHPTNINITVSKSPVSLTNTVISSNSTPSLISISSNSQLNQVSIQPIVTEAKIVDQFNLKEISSSSFSNQKGVTLSTMASIVADAKIAAKLSQTALENISNSQRDKLNPKIISVNEMPKILFSEKPLTTFSSSLNTTESLNNPTKLILSVQPTSVTLSTPKMSIPDLSKKDITLKSKEKLIENQDEVKKEEKEDKIKDESDSSDTSSNTFSESVEEKKTDPLNTTDELESMLEAIHNPAENVENKNDIPTTTLKRMSPVTDDLSLVNILENDTEPVENDKEQISSDSDMQKAMNKTEEIQKNIEEINNDKNTLSNEKNHQEELCTEMENSKPFLQHCLSEEKTLMEESSDDILDMLHNIISSKPEMANSNELKSSLIYQMPTPLDTLPLNILQDSLMDLEQENLENDQVSSTEAKSEIKTENSEVKKSSPPTSQTSTLVVSTVAQLQKSTTIVPHLSPLSKPTELTSNVANVSHQLRTLLSSLQSNQTTVNQTGVVTMVSSVKSGSILSTSSPLSTLNSLNNVQSGVSTLTRLDQSRSQSSKDSELAMKEKKELKECSGVITTISKGSNNEQIFRITSSATTLQTTTVSTISSTSPAVTSRTITTSISITSNAMLNAMLAGTTSLKPSIAGHGRSNTVPTQSANLLSSVLPSTSIQRSQNLQAILQVSAGCSTPPRVLVNTSSAVTSSMQCLRTIVPPLVTSSGVSSTPSILQSTLSQAPSPLLISNQYKSSLLSMDNKNNDLENQSTTMKKDPEESKIQEKKEIDSSKSSSNSLRLEESQNVLLKQLLQNTACATTSGSSQGPSLPIVPSLEAQLARPVLPTPPSLLPQLLNETPTPKPIINKQVLARETSFLSHSVTPLKVQSSPTKEESAKPSLPSNAITSQRTESLKQQTTKSIPTSSGSSVSNQQPVSSITTTKTSPNISTNQQETSGNQNKLGTSISEGHQTQQRVAVSISKVGLQNKPLVTSGIVSKSVQLATSNSSNVSGPQVQQSQNQTAIAQKPNAVVVPVVQQQVPSSSATSVQQQSVQQQVPHNHGAVAVPPQIVIGSAAPPGSNTVPLVEVKKEIGFEDVLSTANTSANQLQTDTKDFLTTKEELIDGAIDDKTGK